MSRGQKSLRGPGNQLAAVAGRILVKAAVPAFLGLLALGCARNLDVKFPGSVTGPTGSVTVTLTRSADDVAVTVNNVMVVQGAHTRRVHIREVEAGFVDICVIAGINEKQFRVWIDPGKDVSLPVAMIEPPPQMSWVSTLISVGASFLALALF